MLRKKRPATVDSPLDAVPLLAGLTPEQRRHLAEQMLPVSFGPGESAVVEGKHGVGFFFIVSGTATVAVDGATRRVLGPGDYYGEVALLSDDGTRSATVTADTDLQCMAMTAWQFRAFLKEHPDISWQIISTMGRRLAEG